jgi:hypothetical protein
MPRIEFLEPLVVEVVQEDGTLNILIETQLEGKYEKFNNNMGYVKGRVENDTLCSLNRLIDKFNQYGFGRADGIGAEIGAIEEGSEEEEESEDEGIVFDTKVSGPDQGEYRDVHPKHFPQAFSHFTYEKSKRKLIVVDLQGVFKENEDGSTKYVLTDPVIHKWKQGKHKLSKRLETWTFGRTDRHEKGMKAFFETHECSEVCRLLGLKGGSESRNFSRKPDQTIQSSP